MRVVGIDLSANYTLKMIIDIMKKLRDLTYTKSVI